MKILRIIGSMDPKSGGPCQGIRNSVPEFKKFGDDTEVVSLDSPDTSFGGIDLFQIHKLGPSFSPWAYTAKLIPWLNENLHRFDVVIIHGLWQFHGYAVRKVLSGLVVKNSGNAAGKVKKPRCFVMPHGMLDPYFQKDPARRLKAFRNRIYWRLVEKKIVNGADGVLFTCEEELILAKKAFDGYNPRRAINAGYGIATPPVITTAIQDSFRRKFATVGSKKYFLFLSRLHQKKGLRNLIAGYAECRELEAAAGRLEDFPVLVIAGAMNSPFAKEIKELAISLGLGSADDGPDSAAVFFTGQLQGNAKWAAFHGCDAFVLPSHQENFGIAVVEALSCGKPVLISDKVNIWREIESSGGGIVGTDDQPGVLRILLQWMSLSPDQREAMGHSAKITYEKHFSIEPAAATMRAAIASS